MISELEIIVFPVGIDPANQENLIGEINRRDQAELVAPDVENGRLAHLIGRSEIGPQCNATNTEVNYCGNIIPRCVHGWPILSRPDNGYPHCSGSLAPR